MDLRSFIRETLCQISDGMIDAQEALRDKGIKINPPHTVQSGEFKILGFPERQPEGDYYQSIDFDIALTVSDATKGGGGVGLSVLSVSLKAGLEEENLNSSVSRVRFRIAALLPQYKAGGK